MYKTKKFFVVLTQLVTGLGFLLVGLVLHLPWFFSLCIFLMAIIAFSGATHDIATDGVYMARMSKESRLRGSVGKVLSTILLRLWHQEDWFG